MRIRETRENHSVAWETERSRRSSDDVTVAYKYYGEP